MKQEVSSSYEEAQISKADIRRQNNETHERTKLAALKKSGTKLRALMKYTNEKGANHWLIIRPDKEKGLVLRRSDFTDAIRMRYAIGLNNLPTRCVCSADYTYSHALRFLEVWTTLTVTHFSRLHLQSRTSVFGGILEIWTESIFRREGFQPARSLQYCCKSY